MCMQLYACTCSWFACIYLSPSMSAKGLYPEGNNLFFEEKKFFKQMAVARSIFTLGGAVQLFWAAFDMPMTGVPLKVALGYTKIDFCTFQKNNHGHTLDTHLGDLGILGK